MSLHPSTPSSTILRQRPFELNGWTMGCAREELHLCKVRNGDVLAACWPWLKEGLLFIAKKNGTRTHWLPEHVRREIATSLFATHQGAIENGLTHQNAMELFVAHEDIVIVTCVKCLAEWTKADLREGRCPNCDNTGLDVRTKDTLNGFIIAYPLFDPFVNLPLSWFIWMGGINPGVLDKLLPEFEAQARRRGYTKWEWKTARKSWATRAMAFGAQVVEYCIEKEL